MQFMTPILSILDNSVLCSSQFIISDIFHESYSLHSIVISQNKSTFHELFLYHCNIGFPAFFSSFPLFFLLLKKNQNKMQTKIFYGLVYSLLKIFIYLPSTWTLNSAVFTASQTHCILFCIQATLFLYLLQAWRVSF